MLTVSAVILQTHISVFNLIPALFVYKSHSLDWKEAAGPKLKSYENT